MNKYTIYCTESQTRKALELGAPIKNVHYNNDGGYEYADNPTAEQMRGWLRSQGFKFKMVEWKEVHWQCSIPPKFYQSGNNPSLEEAAHAAIDTALEYLENLKQ